jgi:hypothetical protein
MVQIYIFFYSYSWPASKMNMDHKIYFQNYGRIAAALRESPALIINSDSQAKA